MSKKSPSPTCQYDVWHFQVVKKDTLIAVLEEIQLYCSFHVSKSE